MLSADEEGTASAVLTEEVLPEILRLSRGRRLVLMCGLAPGADLLFLRVAGRWLESRRIPFAQVGVLPVPVRMLEQDWSHRANLEGYTVSGRDRAQLLEQLQAAESACETRIDLAAGVDPDRLATAAGRQQQYRWLGAVLATRTDALLAVLRPGIRSQPGGTSEVVRWRRDPDSMPESLRRGVAGAVVPSGAALFVIDPSRPTATATAAAGIESRSHADLAAGWQPAAEDEALTVAQAARCALFEGNDLLCNDLVYRAFERGLSSPQLAWLRVQSLANVGSTELALRQYRDLAPPPPQRDAPWLTLLGRLQKDRVLQDGHGGATALVEAAQSYLSALRLQPDSYPAINAATLLVLAGEREQGRRWARQALQLLGDAASTGDRDAADRYFAHATAAEAYLILDQPQQARDALALADQLLPGDFWRRQRTLRQLRRLCRSLDLDPALLGGLRPPPLIVLRRAGDLIDEPPAAFELVADELPAHATWFVSLGDVHDLCAIEALLARGQALHACLPFSANAMIEYAHLGYGEHWGQRLENCLGRLRRLTVARGFLESERRWAAMEARDCAVGLAHLAAHRGVGDFRVFDLVARAGGASLQAAVPPEAWPPGGGIADATPSGRRMVGLIFADIAGFMRLDDPDLPAFWGGVMTDLGALLDAYGEDVLLSQTWGDALHVVTASAAVAADIAQAIQALVQGLLDADDRGLPRLELRVAVHYAPAFEGQDPIQHARTYYGTQLTFTARIEPVTPPGQVYVTEALAARLAVEAPERFVCDYVGEIQLAKRFGDYRVYAMRPAQSRAN